MANVRADLQDRFPGGPKVSLALPDGRLLQLFDPLTRDDIPAIDCARNIVLRGQDGSVVWTITSDFDQSGDPFTNVMLEGTAITAYRWDGGLYAVDIETGEASPRNLLR